LSLAESVCEIAYAPAAAAVSCHAAVPVCARLMRGPLKVVVATYVYKTGPHRVAA
jgi:hypothetical protein